LLLESTSALSV